MKFICEFTKGDHVVSLWRYGTKRFKVVYGSDEQTGLTYEEACKHFGKACFHSLACAGKLDPTGP